MQHPWFIIDLPRYLTPLPPPPGPVVGTLSSLVTPPKHVVDFEIIDGLGRIEEDVVEELTSKLVGVDKEEVWDSLRRNDGVQGNQVKVAYMLLRDKRMLGKDCKLGPRYNRMSVLCTPVISGGIRRARKRRAAGCIGCTHRTKFRLIILTANPPPATKRRVPKCSFSGWWRARRKSVRGRVQRRSWRRRI